MSKKIFKKALAVIMILWSPVTWAQGLQDCLHIHDKEKDVMQLNVEGNDWLRQFDTTNLQNHSREFYENFMYTDNIPGNPPGMLDSCNERVSITDICKLYTDIVKTGQYHADSDFAALKIVYGMEGKRLVMIYEPIILRKEKDFPGNWHDYTIDTSINKSYRLAANGILQDIDKTQKASLVEAYTGKDSHFYFKRRRPHQNHRYRRSIDVIYVVLLMQDIISVYVQNPSPINPDPKITFSFVSNGYKYGILEKYKAKVHIVVHYNIGINEHVDNKRFSSFGADYSQMYPPRDRVTLETAY